MQRYSDKMLEAAGAQLVRQKKHEVWRLPNGATVVRSKTPHSPSSEYSVCRDIRRAAGR
jgi:predicted Zn-dependent peptidase